MKYYKRPFVTAIIVAAGNSTRMGKVINKQLIKIADKPVLAHTIAAFDAASNINTTIVVCKKNDTEAVIDMCKKYRFAKLAQIVEGGDYRQESVFNGVVQAPSQTTHFAIHDGARCLVRPEDIKKVVNDAIRYKAATLGVIQKDTIKITDKNNFIKGTADRKSLWCTQTPQVFEKEMYIDAMNKAERDDVIYTDDCQLIENMRLPIYMTQGSYDNIKITTQDDVLIASKIIEKRYEE